MEIVSGAAQQSVDRVTAHAGEEVAVEATIGLHVTDHRLDGAAAAQLATDRRRDTTTLTGDEDAAMVKTMSAIATIDVATIDVATCDGNTCHTLDLGNRRGQRVTVIGTARQRHHAKHEPLAIGGGDRDLDAELVALVRLTLRFRRGRLLARHSTSGACSA